MPTPRLSDVVSLSRHRYGYDPAHYPLKGIKYILYNPKMWHTVACVVILGITVALLVLVVLFMFTLRPQAELFGGAKWWSWVLAVFAVLVEGTVIAGALLLVTHSRAQKELFVKTMKKKGRWKEDMIKPSIAKDLAPRRAFWVRIVTLPLNVVPFVGPGLYAAVNATFVGWDYMDMYFDAIKMSTKMQRKEVFGVDRSDCVSVFSPYTYDSNNEYARFGFMCSLIEATPIVGQALFPLTNACGAALFACDIEKKGGPLVLQPPPPPPEKKPMFPKLFMNKRGLPDDLEEGGGPAQTSEGAEENKGGSVEMQKREIL